MHLTLQQWSERRRVESKTIPFTAQQKASAYKKSGAFGWAVNN